MKLALLLAASVASAAFAGTVNSPYQVGTWQGFSTAAVSYTFDDNCGNQYSVAVPMFNAKGFKLTLFTVSGWAGDWSSVKSAAAYGHEIASHTVDHADFNSSSTDQTSECRDSQSAINSNVTSQKCVTLAYPYGSAGSESITSQYYIAARGVYGAIESSTPSDFMGIAGIICGDAGTTDLNGSADSAASSGGWCDFVIHGIKTSSNTNGDGYSPLDSSALQSSINYMDSNRGKFWVQTFGNVVRYIRERNDVSVSETASSSSSLTVSVTGSLDSSIYNFPITIRRPLPSGWTTAAATQGGKDLGAQIVSVNGTQYVMFDAVPNGGNVTVSSGNSPTGGTYKLLSRYSGKALDAYGAGTANGTQIIQWTYGGGANQQWTISSVGNNLYSIIGVGSGKCVDISGWGTANDTKVQLWDYVGGTNQKFYFNPTTNGYYEISPSHATGSCLDVQGPSTADGAVVHLWQWVNANNQQWLVQPVDGTYKLISQYSGSAMDVWGAVTTNGSPIAQCSYNGGANQQWTLTDTGSGNYKFINVKSGRALDVSGGGTANGTKVQLWDYYSNTAQLYKLTSTSVGQFRITPNCAPGSCLEVYGLSTADGAIVDLWQWNGGANQKWSVQAP